MTSARDQFEADHAPGNLTLTASRVPPMVLPREELASYDPSPLAIALHALGRVPIEISDPDPLALGLLEMGHIDEEYGDRLLAKRGYEVTVHQPRLERTADDLGFNLIAYPDAILDTPDGLVGVEYKRLAGGKRQYEEQWAAGPPLRHIAQVEAQMIASQGSSKQPLSAVVLVPLIIERHSVTTSPVWIEANPERQAAIITACQKWWAIIVGGGLPAPDASRSSYEALLATTKLAAGKRLTIDTMEAVERAASWRQARRDRLAAEKVEDAARNWFAARAADAEWLDLPDGSSIKRTFIEGRIETKPRTVRPSWRMEPKEPK